jgi:hypothetical protein
VGKGGVIFAAFDAQSKKENKKDNKKGWHRLDASLFAE